MKLNSINDNLEPKIMPIFVKIIGGIALIIFIFFFIQFLAWQHFAYRPAYIPPPAYHYPTTNYILHQDFFLHKHTEGEKEGYIFHDFKSQKSVFLFDENYQLGFPNINGTNLYFSAVKRFQNNEQLLVKCAIASFICQSFPVNEGRILKIMSHPNLEGALVEVFTKPSYSKVMQFQSAQLNEFIPEFNFINDKRFSFNTIVIDNNFLSQKDPNYIPNHEFILWNIKTHNITKIDALFDKMNEQDKKLNKDLRNTNYGRELAYDFKLKRLFLPKSQIFQNNIYPPKIVISCDLEEKECKETALLIDNTKHILAMSSHNGILRVATMFISDTSYDQLIPNLPSQFIEFDIKNNTIIKITDYKVGTYFTKGYEDKSLNLK